MEIEMALNRIRISRSLLILIIILVLFRMPDNTAIITKFYGDSKSKRITELRFNHACRCDFSRV